MRYSAPEAFDFIRERINQLRGIGEASTTDRKKNIDVELQNAWNLLAESNVGWNSDAAKKLIYVLFPEWGGNSVRNKVVPQGVCHLSPTDYWDRVLSESLSGELLPDQRVLLMYSNWKKAEVNNELVQMLYASRELTEKFEHLVKDLINAQEIRTLASQLFEIALRQNDVKAAKKDITAFEILKKIYVWKETDESEHKKWILSEIEKSLPISMRFSLDLFRSWNYYSKKGITPERVSLHKKVLAEARQIFENNVEGFVNAIDPEAVRTIDELFSQWRDEEEIKEENIKWVGPLLLKAAKIKPHVIIPQCAFLIFFNDVLEEKKEAQLFPEFPKKIFGQDLKRVIELIASNKKYDYLDEEVQSSLHKISKAASEWLKVNN